MAGRAVKGRAAEVVSRWRERLDPREDLVTKLVHAEVDGQRLTVPEFDNFFSLLVVAGNETTRHTITHGMLALLEHPDQMRRLMDDPSLIDYGSGNLHSAAKAFEREALRIMSDASEGKAPVDARELVD